MLCTSIVNGLGSILYVLLYTKPHVTIRCRGYFILSYRNQFFTLEDLRVLSACPVELRCFCWKFLHLFFFSFFFNKQSKCTSCTDPYSTEAVEELAFPIMSSGLSCCKVLLQRATLVHTQDHATGLQLSSDKKVRVADELLGGRCRRDGAWPDAGWEPRPWLPFRHLPWHKVPKLCLSADSCQLISKKHTERSRGLSPMLADGNRQLLH